MLSLGFVALLTAKFKLSVLDCQQLFNLFLINYWRNQKSIIEETRVRDNTKQ